MNKPMHQPPRMMQNVFVLLLLAVFAVLSTLLVLMGAQVYRSTVARAAATNDKRIISAVVRSAVWAQDGGEILIEEYPELDITTLCIVNNYDGDRYFKRLYCAPDEDGVRYLWESFTSEDREFTGQNGETLCELDDFRPSLDGSMLTVALRAPDGTQKTIRLALRAGGAAE